MPRNMRANENMKRSKAKRDAALARVEIGYPTEPRVSAAGPTSFPVKADDVNDRRLIDEALARRGTK